VKHAKKIKKMKRHLFEKPTKDEETPLLKNHKR